jgi:uncharacterized membrane protein YgdD (TMEM256/DUF423 family)
MNVWLFLGSLLAGLSVAAGAFAAHGLDGYFAEKYGSETKQVAGREMLQSEKSLHDFKTGAEYQMYHSLALLVVGLLMERRAVGLLAERRESVWLSLAGWSFLLGIVLFSGSLYVLTITGVSKWGMVTPIGGLAFLVGWTALAVAALTKGNQSSLP